MSVLAVTALLGACGFKPLYGKNEQGRSAPLTELHRVQIAPLPDRNGQVLHNLLRDQMNPYGQPANAAYLLQIALNEREQKLSLRKDETAQRINIVMNVRFTLRPAEGREVLLRGRTQAISSYNVLSLEQHYGTIAGQRDARERALRQLARDIHQRLAVYFSGQTADDGG